MRISCIESNFNSFLFFFNLKELKLDWNYRQDEITNLSFLLNFPNLEILKLNDGKITDLEPTKDLKNLKNFCEKSYERNNRKFKL